MSPSTTLNVHQPPWRGRASRVDPSTWWEWDSWRWFCILLPLKHGFKQSLLGFNDCKRLQEVARQFPDVLSVECGSHQWATNFHPSFSTLPYAGTPPRRIALEVLQGKLSKPRLVQLFQQELAAKLAMDAAYRLHLFLFSLWRLLEMRLDSILG